MCYVTIISTNSDIDLQKFNSGKVVFKEEMPGIPEEQKLMYPKKWYADSNHGCSCGFRHLMACNFPALGFADPEEWFKESPEDIEATLVLVQAFNEVVSSGAKLDCIDAWAEKRSDWPDELGNVVVNLAVIPETSFRLIENYRHEIINET